MSHFQYFVPGRQRLTHQECREIGLGYAFESNPAPRPVDSGPDGQRGVVLCATDERIGFYPGKQTWRRFPGNATGLWCGMFDDQPPRPGDLARAELVPGNWLRLEDGHQWLAPMARRFEEIEDRLCWSHTLPTSLELDDEGRVVQGDVRPRYRRLWELAMRYEEAYLTAAADAPSRSGMVKFDFAEADELVPLALQVNYRVSLVELVMLGVYDTQMRTAVLDVLIDQATQLEFFKKKLAALPEEEPATIPFCSGPSGSRPAD